MNSRCPITRMEVYEIRPDSLKAQMEAAAKADKTWVRLNISHFVKGACPLCGSQQAASRAYALDDGLCYDRCDKCSTLFLRRHPSIGKYQEFYEISEVMRLFASQIFPQSRVARIRNIYAPRLERMLNCYNGHGNDTRMFLEIGAGSGDFAHVVQNSGVFSSCVAVEPNPACAHSCREQGIHVIEKPIELVEASDLPGTPTLIGCFEVLAHLFDPVDFVNRVYDMLPPGGLFCLTTPNGLGFDVLELREKSTTLGITYIHLFNPFSLGKLLEKAGFTILEISTPGALDISLVERGYRQSGVGASDNWLANFILNGNADMKNDLQDFLVVHGQSSHMWAACIKP